MPRTRIYPHIPHMPFAISPDAVIPAQFLVIPAHVVPVTDYLPLPARTVPGSPRVYAACCRRTVVPRYALRTGLFYLVHPVPRLPLLPAVGIPHYLLHVLVYGWIVRYPVVTFVFAVTRFWLLHCPGGFLTLLVGRYRIYTVQLYAVRCLILRAFTAATLHFAAAHARVLPDYFTLPHALWITPVIHCRCVHRHIFCRYPVGYTHYTRVTQLPFTAVITRYAITMPLIGRGWVTLLRYWRYARFLDAGVGCPPRAAVATSVTLGYCVAFVVGL